MTFDIDTDIALSQYHCWILRLSAIQKKSADSAVIYHGFCGYLSWILWLSGTNIGLRDASASKKASKSRKKLKISRNVKIWKMLEIPRKF